MISCNFGCFLRCVCLSREAEKQRIGRGMGSTGQKGEIGIGEEEEFIGTKQQIGWKTEKGGKRKTVCWINSCDQ